MPGERPQWPADLLYLPVAHDGKGPDTAALPGTWSTDGVGCVTHDELTDRRWGIVDVGVDGHRLLIIDLDLYKLDADTKQTVLDGLETIPPTRIHESQSGGKHVFFWIRTDELTEDETLPVQLAEGIDDKLNGYVLAAGWCEGYAVAVDEQPAEITVADIPDEWIKQTPDRGSDDTDDRFTGGRSGTPPSGEDPEVPHIHEVISASQHPEGERVPHPMGARHAGGGRSSSGTNFMVDEGGETWRCWRHDVTGNALHLLGMEEGLFDCGDWKHGGIPTTTWQSVFEAAEERGLIEETTLEPEARAPTAAALDAKTHYDSIDAALFPEEANFILDKPPREGGSYALTTELVDSGDSFIILASRHSILDYHLETVQTLLSERETVVHFQGRNSVCDHGEDCPRFPRDYDEYLDFREEVRDALHRKSALTAEDAPGHICPYWFLLTAAQEARAVITVPQLLPRIDREFSEMRLMIDEEQTLDFFRPGSVSLLEVGPGVEADGTRTIQSLATPIRHEHHTLEQIKAEIEDDQAERREEAEAEGRNWRALSYETDILEAIETVTDLKDRLGVTAAVDAIDGETVPDVVEKLRDRVRDVEFPDPTTETDRLMEKIAEYCAPYYWDEDADPSSLLEAVLFPYDTNPFDFKRTGATYTLRLIGDRVGELFHQDALNEFEQISLIAGPEGERFLETLEGEPESIVIDEFRYAEDFLVLPMGREYDDGLEPVGQQRARVEQVSQLLNQRAVPHLAVAGTSEQANAHQEILPEGGPVIRDPEKPAISLFLHWSTGETAIIYENSIVSRGIDAPFFDITTITSSGFATPYWEARKDHWKGEDTDEYLKARAVEEELKARELTNAAVRMATTRDVEEQMGSKIIVAAASDVRKIKYLQDRTLPRVADPERAADILDMLTAAGGARLAAEEVYDELGGSEKQFIAVASQETITPKRQSRPEYTLDEASEWVKEDWFDLDTLTRVKTRRAESERPIVEAIPDLSEGQISTLESILDRKS